MSVQSLVYAAVIMFGAPMVIEGSMTTGAVVAASMLGSRMIAPMANLCGVLARWQQVKAAKMGLDNIMQLPTETQHDDSLIHRDILHGHYLFENAQFRYHNDDQRIPLRLVRLEIMPCERIAILGRNGAGKSTLYRRWRRPEMIQEMPGLIISACRTSIWRIYAATSAFLARTRGFSSAPYERT